MLLNKNYVRRTVLFAACLSLLLLMPSAKAQSATPYLQWSSGGFEVWSPTGQDAGAPSMFAGTGYSEEVLILDLPAGATATVSCSDTEQGVIFSMSGISNGSYGGSWSPRYAGSDNVRCSLSYTSPSGDGGVSTGMVSIRVY